MNFVHRGRPSTSHHGSKSNDSGSEYYHFIMDLLAAAVLSLHYNEVSQTYLFGDKSIEKILVCVVAFRVHNRRILCLGNNFGVFQSTRKFFESFFACPFGLACGQRKDSLLRNERGGSEEPEIAQVLTTFFVSLSQLTGLTDDQGQHCERLAE